MRVGSLSCHLADADLYKIYQVQVVAEELLDWHEGVMYTAKEGHGKLKCPFPLFTGELASGWMLQWNFCNLHPLDYVTIPREGQYPRCLHCGMQVDLRYPAHINTKECRAGTERCHQRDMPVRTALALHKQFTVHGYVLEKVKIYKYLGCLLLQDKDNIQAVRIQLRKAQGLWARVGQVLRRENAPPRTSAKFYQAIVQFVLLYGSKTWVLSKAIMARLEGFQIRAAYWMAKEQYLDGGPTASGFTCHPTKYSRSAMHTIQHYINVRQQTIAQYVVDRSIFAECREADQRCGLVPRQWRWEQRMCMDDI
jgi:hypothetical protein